VVEGTTGADHHAEPPYLHQATLYITNRAEFYAGKAWPCFHGASRSKGVLSSTSRLLRVVLKIEATALTQWIHHRPSLVRAKDMPDALDHTTMCMRLHGWNTHRGMWQLYVHAVCIDSMACLCSPCTRSLGNLQGAQRKAAYNNGLVPTNVTQVLLAQPRKSICWEFCCCLYFTLYLPQCSKVDMATSTYSSSKAITIALHTLQQCQGK